MRWQRTSQPCDEIDWSHDHDNFRCGLMEHLQLNPDSQVVGLVEGTRDISVVAPLIVVDRLLRQIDDLSEQAKRLGAWTLIALLVIGGTDVSGGLSPYPYSRL